MLILDLWGISFHAVVVFTLGKNKNLLFKSALGHCVVQNFPQNIFNKDKAKVVPFAYLLSSYNKYELACQLWGYCAPKKPKHTLISLINVTSRILILENSTLHRTKINPARLFISLQNFQYSYRIWWRFFSQSFWAINLYSRFSSPCSSIKFDGKSPVDFATFAPLHVYSNLHGY